MDELLAVVPPIFRLAAQKSNPPDHTFNLSLCHQCAAHPRFLSQMQHSLCSFLHILFKILLMHILHMLIILQIQHLLHIFVFCISNIQLVTLPTTNVLHSSISCVRCCIFFFLKFCNCCTICIICIFFIQPVTLPATNVLHTKSLLLLRGNILVVLVLINFAEVSSQ